VNYIHIVVCNSSGATATSGDLTYDNADDTWYGELTIPDANFGYFLFEAFAYSAKTNGSMLFVGDKVALVDGDLTGNNAISIGLTQVSLAGGSIIGSVPGVAHTVAFWPGADGLVPMYITTDGYNIYATTSSGKVIELGIFDGSTYTTIASGFASDSLQGIVYGAGSLFIAAGSHVYKITRSGTVWGSPSEVSMSGSKGISQAAQLTYLNGCLYIADSGNGTIDKLDLSNSSNDAYLSSDYTPYGVATDGTNLFLASYYNDGGYYGQIYESTDLSSFTNLFDFNGDSGTAPMALIVDGTFQYATDLSDNAIFKCNAGGNSYSTIGTSSLMSEPTGICSDGLNLYIADQGKNEIFKLVSQAAAPAP
jgi:hypothetical protein